MKTLLYEQIMAYVLELLEANRLMPDFKLPSENQLVKKFNASRQSVGKAYALLEKKKHIVRVQGKGTFANRDAPQPAAKKVMNNIALIIPSTETKFANNIVRGITTFCDENSLNLLIMQTANDPEKEVKYIKAVSALDFKGLLIFPVDNETFNEELLRLSIGKFPIIMIDRLLNGINIGYVCTDHYSSTFETVRYLRAKRYKHIVYIASEPKVTSTYLERINGFEQGLLTFYDGIRPYNTLRLKADRVDHAAEQIEKFLAAHPEVDAVIINGYTLSLAFFHALEALDQQRHTRLQPIIYDDEFIAFDHIIKSKAFTILQDSLTIGYNAAKALYRQICGDLRPIKEKIPAKLITRE
ncbi:MAG: substrate-binding domain-containing protein [Clostridiales bacterium]|jgi:DNA-binding LacI/PurR family transcriptional regulator|nr:substrate-binding domain-containing protein [Clostridiales bacterium]